MSARLTFLRRTAKEAEVFGGEVYFDLDGRNLGRLAATDAYVDLPAGRHTIRMYKSHTYGTMVGFADAVVELREGENLLVRYTPPMTVNQPGTIMLQPYSDAAAEAFSRQTAERIAGDQETERQKQEQARRGTSRFVLWFVLGTVGTALLVGLLYLLLFSSLTSAFL